MSYIDVGSLLVTMGSRDSADYRLQRLLKAAILPKSGSWIIRLKLFDDPKVPSPTKSGSILISLLQFPITEC